MLAGVIPPRHVMGTIVKVPTGYNPPWSFHLDPESVNFFDNGLEICDASISYVEANLDGACTIFLPDCVWCPWGSRLIAEIAPTSTPTPSPPTWFIFLPIVKDSGN